MKIVSLCPSLTELVFDLGAGDELVGITTFCIHPADRVGAVETVGGTKTPDCERILQLAPDVVLMNEEENREEDADVLAAAGIHVHNSFPRDADDTAAMVRSIAATIGRPGPGELVAAEIEESAVEARAAAGQQARTRFVYMIWRKPWMCASGDTFVSNLLELAGGENVIGHEGERYPEMEAALLAAADPDVVLLSSEPFPFEERHADELALASGLPRERFQLVDGELLSWHGSRTPSGIRYAADLIGGLSGA